MAHWHNTAAGGRDGLLNGQVAAPAAPAGNAANAVEVATTQAKKVSFNLTIHCTISKLTIFMPKASGDPNQDI